MEWGTLFPFGLTSLSSHPPTSPRSEHLPGPPSHWAIEWQDWAPGLQPLSPVCPAYGRFMMFFSLLSGVWLFVSMVK